MQVLYNLLDSLILILSHNFYIGNIAPKNVFLSVVGSEFIVKFSNLVDFSFDYNQIADKFYAIVYKKKPT